MSDPSNSDPSQQRLSVGDRIDDVMPLRHWSLQRSNDGRGYLLGLTTQEGTKCVLRLRSLDILGMAQAVLDDIDRARSVPTVQ